VRRALAGQFFLESVFARRDLQKDVVCM
jgi:hypothetical protein